MHPDLARIVVSSKRLDAQRKVRLAVEAHGGLAQAARVLGLSKDTVRRLLRTPERVLRTTIGKVLRASIRPPTQVTNRLPLVAAPGESYLATLRRILRVASAYPGRARRFGLDCEARRAIARPETVTGDGIQRLLVDVAQVLDGREYCRPIHRGTEISMASANGFDGCERCGQLVKMGAAAAVAECFGCGRGLSADRVVVAKERPRRRGGSYAD
jgi:hypothetical protein